MASSSNEKICKICNIDLSKYCCPRCNMLYCSVVCYKSDQHLQCSESFYRDCIEQELNSRDDNSMLDSKKKMLEILTKLNNTENEGSGDEEGQELCDMLQSTVFNADDENVENSDDEEIPALADRLCGIDLNNAHLVWDNLTNDEKLEFEGLLSSGDVTKFVPEWTPWWMYKQENKLVEDLTANQENKYKENCPTALKSIKCFSEISKVLPSSCVKCNLINILGAYAYTARLFNGEHQESALESINCWAAISTNINSNQNFNDVDVALASVGQACLEFEFLECDQEAISTMKNDVKLIMEGPGDSDVLFYTISSLSDLHKLLRNAKNSIDSDSESPKIANSQFSKRFVDHNTDQFPMIPKQKLKTYIKKIEYYLSFTKSFQNKM